MSRIDSLEANLQEDDSLCSSVSSVSVNIEDLDSVTIVHALGCALEVKSKSIDDAGLNECFCNMFGSGTRLATMLLRMGKIVKEVTMYGIVVSMQDHTKVSTLKMTMDFSNSQCTYWRVRQQMSFVDTLNIVLSKLAN